MTAGPGDILLVEDNPSDVLMARKAVERSSFAGRLHVVTDGEQALDFLFRRGEFADSPRPDLVLLDINLPRVNGNEVLRRVKEDDALRCVPVVMLTSSDRDRDIDESYSAHANSFITKPPGLKELTEIINSLDHYWFRVVRRSPGGPR